MHGHRTRICAPIDLVSTSLPRISFNHASNAGTGKMSQTSGSVMVVGGGIAGMQAALDLADSGFFVYLVERSSSIGGIMAQLDKTFPTNDCSM